MWNRYHLSPFLIRGMKRKKSSPSSDKPLNTDYRKNNIYQLRKKRKCMFNLDYISAEKFLFIKRKKIVSTWGNSNKKLEHHCDTVPSFTT